MTAADPTVPWTQVFVAFLVVFGLMALLAYALKYISTGGLRLPAKIGRFQLRNAATRKQRLRIVESLALDIRRRLVIVQCDGRQHLLLLGANQDIVIESNVKSEFSSEGQS